MILDEDDNNIKIQALSISKVNFKYQCPYCYRNSKGRINSKKGKPNYHYHGSNEDFSNRTEHRSSHCTINDKKKLYIEINDYTIRDY